MARDTATSHYTSTHGLYREARATYESFDPEDIDDGDGNKAIIVDTILSAYGYSPSDVAQAIEDLGGTLEDCCEECRRAGDFRTGEDDSEPCEWLEETLEDVAGREAGRINAHLPDGAEGSFNFEWNDGAFVLMYWVYSED
jgi:hypothetical protein